MNKWWPLTGLRLRTPRLELRPASDSDLSALADLAAAGLHDPAVQPFTYPWTDVPPDERGRSVLRYHWSQRAAWKPDPWSLDLAVVLDGTVVGTQGVSARDFAILREVSTESWLGREYHGQGVGTEMRAAVLHLAFTGLGAEYAISGAFTDNAASRRISRELGYADNGVERHVSRGRPATVQRFRIDRQAWEATRAIPVTIAGLEPCLRMFGLPAASDQAT